MYGRRWQRVRAAFLREHPLCVEHERKGEYVAATDVDHRVPHRGDQDLFWSAENWQSLCHACHAAKTAREVNERRAPGYIYLGTCCPQASSQVV